MKKLIIALVFGMGLTGFAQETATKPTRADVEKMTPEQRQEKHLAHLAKKLGLDPKQKEAVGKILAEKSAKMQDAKTKKAAQKAAGDKMTPEEKTAYKNTIQAEKADTEAKMKAVLSADQYQKWVSMREENQEKMKERTKEM